MDYLHAFLQRLKNGLFLNRNELNGNSSNTNSRYQAICFPLGPRAPTQTTKIKYQRPLLGSGSFGEVRTCVDKATGSLLAVKLMRKGALREPGVGPRCCDALHCPICWSKSDEKRRRLTFRYEARLLEISRHANVVQHKWHAEDWPELGVLALVMELMDGNMAELCRALIDGGEEDVEGRALAYDMLGQILRGLEHIHSLGLVHRDVKPANILYRYQKNNKDYRFKIADFGSATEVDKADNREHGTYCFMAPESLGHHVGLFGTESKAAILRVPKALDIYSLGATLMHVMDIQGFRSESWRLSTQPGALSISIETSAPVWFRPWCDMLIQEPERRPTAHALIDRHRGRHSFEHID